MAQSGDITPEVLQKVRKRIYGIYDSAKMDQPD
jgi:hypothetical protein